MRILNFAAVVALSFVSIISQAVSNPPVYRIQGKLYLDGKLISQPSIITTAGESAEISQFSEDLSSKIKIEVIASEKNNERVKNGILLKFKVEYDSPTKKAKASPEILVFNGEESSILVGNTQGKDGLELKVVTTRE